MLLIVCGAFLFVVALIFVLRHFGLIPVRPFSLYDENKNYHVSEYDDHEYYIIDADYSGEYDIEYKVYFWNNDEENSVPSEEFFESSQKVMTFSEYSSFTSKYGFGRKYADASVNYIVYPYISSCSVRAKARLANVERKFNSVNLFIYDDLEGCTAMAAAYLIVIPVDKNEVPTSTTIETTALYTSSEFNDIKNGTSLEDNIIMSYKPIIYLYPETETELIVKLGKPENLTASYPAYTTGWRISARPDGTLTDLETGRELYSLYWEGETNRSSDFPDGFVVAGSDTIPFLEEKLALLGLNEREAEEFIVYWLPKMQKNAYNLIRFETLEEINESMSIEFSVEPDTLIRVMMDYKPLETYKEVKEQSLPETPVRNGFTVVEWGGSEL